MALTFDLLKVSRVDKQDPRKAKAAALEALISTAVDAALKDGALIGDAAALKKVICTSLQYVAGNLLVQGEVKTKDGTLTPYTALKKAYAASQSGTSQASVERSQDLASQDVSADSSSSRPRPAQSGSTQAADGKLDVLLAAYGHLGIIAPPPNKKSVLAKLPAAEVRKLFAHMQSNITQDANGDELDFEEQLLEIKHGKAGVPTAQDMKDAIWGFLTSDV